MAKRKKSVRRDRPINGNVLKSVSALTQAQREVFIEWHQGQHVAMLGYAGTGKSFLGCYLGMSEVLSPDNPISQLVITRTLEPTKNIGFLPGTEDEKMAPYELPYTRIFNELFTYQKAYESFKYAGLVKFMTTSHIRGITLDNAVLLIDEVQSMSVHEFYSLLTRAGKNTKIIVCGDGLQNDLGRGSCFEKAQDLLESLEEVSSIYFEQEDIVRSKFVKNVIIQAERLGIT